MKYSLLTFCLFLPFLAHTQGRLAAFSAVRLDRENVQVNWTMKAGVSCQSPEVQRSTDTLNFSSIFRYPGVCGGGATEESFSWIDKNALADRDTYYRLRIDDGEFSEIFKIEGEVALAENAVQPYPSPAIDILNLAYREELGSIEEIGLFNSHGTEIKIDLLSSLNESPLRIQTTALPAGLYFLWIVFSEENSFKVKFLVVK
ncbi:MAG: hypothetical protein CMP59_12020 [Flavobacteriales bacterium]|nr:hypothetical protein [Flavobacteriales bacterium]|tara:strand:+ start:105 stop:710 length:606 start_codon:yes stop_codon:yes gene_type:complete